VSFPHSGRRAPKRRARRRLGCRPARIASLSLGLFALGVGSAHAAPPTIVRTTLSAVTAESATLEADVNPAGKATLYHFEYGLEDCATDPCANIPVPDKGITAGESPVRVKAKVEGLAPDTTYHFRIVVRNEDGTVKGPDRTFTTFGPGPVFPSCPGDNPFRIDRPSEALPDCRAYEQASPVNKNGLDASGSYLMVKSPPSGEAVSFVTASGTPYSSGTQEPPMHLSLRGAGNWLTHGLLPPQEFGQRAGVVGWTPNFSHVFIEATRFTTPATKALLDMRPDGSITEVVPYSAPGSSFSFVGASADDSKIFFEAGPTPLAPFAPVGKRNLYVWETASEEISFIGVLPDSECSPPPCAPAGGSVAGPYDWVNGAAKPGAGGSGGFYYTQEQRAISSAGDSAYFTAGGTAQLYRRLDPTGPGAETVHVSASEKGNGTGQGGHDVNGARPAAFMGASEDGSVAFFTSSEKLTDDATTGPEPDEAPAIARANLTDGSEKKMDFLPAHAYGVAVHGEFIYWADPDADAIGRAKLNGTGAASDVKPIFIPEAGEDLRYVAVDDEHVYWTNAPPEATLGERRGTIGRAKLNGAGDPTDVEPDFITGASNPKGVAVDNEFIYWANNCPGEKNSPSCPLPTANALRTIGRADIEGTPVSVDQGFLEVGNGGQEREPQGIAVNATHIYMAMNGTQELGLVNRYKIDGDEGSLKVFLDAQYTGIPGVRGLALDGKYAYWAREGRNTIGRIPLGLEEADAERDWTPNAHAPKGLAIDAQHVYWAANQEVLANPGNDLYRYSEKASPLGKHLDDLTVDTTDQNGAEVRGALGISADSSYIYFVANGVPDGVLNSPNGEGESAGPGDCKEILQDSGSGVCNLYAWHEGEISFIARLTESDNENWSGTMAGVELVLNQFQKPARVSADGKTLLFSSHRKLTEYDNENKTELYRYVVGEAAPSCISCDPSGAAPIEARARNVETPVLPNETFPAATLSRNLSVDGKRVVFETTDALVGTDVNGLGGCPIVGSERQRYPTCQDVYEWEAKGSGSCESEAQNGGCLYLISTGRESEPSFLADASVDGEDVLFFTRAPLVRQDRDRLMDVYDARVGGGLTAQDVVKPICESENGCKVPPPPQPNFDSPPTTTFVGPESPGKARPKTCPKGKRRVKGKGKRKSRCVAKKRVHKQAGKGNRNANKKSGEGKS
jgi:hypothetical protein